MILPISHDKMTVRRMPVVTIVLIFVTVACHVVISLASRDKELDAMRALVTARTLYVEHPGLGVCRALEPFEGESATREEAGGAFIAEREEYERACKELDDALESIPSQRLGYTPARTNFLGLFTYVFVHGDIFHVVGNMWFLFLCGMALEDRWGRLAFPVYYFVAGVIAAGAHHLAMPHSTSALIGASGAVAGAMGAFLVLYATSKIRFVALVAVRPVMFSAPAYVMLPLWVGVEMLFGLVLQGSSTAHWAHVGGFLFGVAAAGALRVAGVDRKLDDAVEKAAVLGDDPRVDAALLMIGKGDAKQAQAMLEGLAKEKPSSIHVWEALHEAAKSTGDAKTATEAAAKADALSAAKGRVSVPRTSTPSIPRASAPSTARASTPSVPRASSAVGTPTAPATPSSTADATPFFPVAPKKGETEQQ